jgi:hypothetical protein
MKAEMILVMVGEFVILRLRKVNLKGCHSPFAKIRFANWPIVI